MKKFSRITALLLSLVLVVAIMATASCKSGETGSDGLTKARAYLQEMYKDVSTVTPSDYDRVNKILIDGETYSITWSVDVSSGVTVSDAGTSAHIDVDEKTAEEIAYKLTATITSPAGKTAELVYDYTVPAYKESGYADFAALEKGSACVVKGVVTGIISKTNGNSTNGLYLQSDDGGFYVYNMADDPVTKGIQQGMTVSVTGEKDIYSGTYEIINATVEIAESSITALNPADYTEKYKAASSLKDESLTSPQSFLVTIKGVEVTGEDLNSGYFKFKLGELESYVRISSSVCPLVSADRDTFKAGHAEHLGWIADVTGIVCLYDGAFYLTPVSADAFSYVSLPEKTDAEKVAFEKENLTLPSAVTQNQDIALVTKGQSYDTVEISYVSDNACAVVSDGTLKITLPEEAASVKVTATLKCGSVTDTKEFTIAVDAAEKVTYTATQVTAPVVETAYKLGLVQKLAGKTLYFSGEMNGNYLASTDKPSKATDVYLETSGDGYRMYFLKDGVKNYIDINEYTAGKAGVRITTEPSAVYKYDTTLNTLVANVASDDRYIGTYKTFETFSASSTSYITGDNAKNIGETQFPAYFYTLTEQEITYTSEQVTAPAADTAYKFGLVQKLAGKTLYFSGEMNGNYLASTDKPSKATDVYLETSGDGYRMYFLKDGVKNYIDIYEYTAGKAGVRITTEPSAVYKYDTTLNTLIANVASDDRYIGTYKTYETFSASSTSYITGDNAKNIGETQFPAYFYTVTPSA